MENPLSFIFVFILIYFLVDTDLPTCDSCFSFSIFRLVIATSEDLLADPAPAFSRGILLAIAILNSDSSSLNLINLKCFS